MSSTLLQIFLYCNVLVVGVLATIAVQHAYAHFRPHQPVDEKKDDKPQSRADAAPGGQLPPAVKDAIVQASQANFQLVLDRNVAELEHDLSTTVSKLTQHLDKLGSTVINTEMERYSKQLEKLRQQAEQAIGGAQSDIDKHQTELQAKLAEQRTVLEAKMAEEMAAQKQQLADQLATEQQQLSAQIDSKLGDAVASFLLETLQHNVDLGAQNTYLTAMLEEHKDDFKREISHDS